LKKGGRCYITYFLLNSESLPLIESRQSTLDFKYVTPRYRTIDENIPEHAVAYEEEKIRELYQQNQMKILEPIHYGSWCGRKTFFNYQDIVIARKEV